MRVGLLDTWLPRRYLGFWRAYLRELGAELVEPERPFADALTAEAPDWASLPLRAVLGRVDELKGRVDRILVPDAQLGVDSERGAGQCPWVRDLAATLRHLRPSAPPFFVVPTEPTERALGIAAEIGAQVTESPPRVRLALERTRKFLVPPGPFVLPGASREPEIGLVAEPYLLEEPRLYRDLLEGLSDLKIGVADRPPAFLREEGRRMGIRAELPTDLEWAGAAHYLARHHAVQKVLAIIEPECAGFARVARWISKAIPKPLVVVPLGTPAGEVRARLLAV